MNDVVVDNNYIGLLDIYNQMFPSLDSDVIKMVVDEIMLCCKRVN